MPGRAFLAGHTLFTADAVRRPFIMIHFDDSATPARIRSLLRMIRHIHFDCLAYF